MRTIATLSEAVAALLLLHLCGCGSANDCELGENDAVFCALCSDTRAGVRWTAISSVKRVAILYTCISPEGSEIQLNDACFDGQQLPDPSAGSETVSWFHMFGSTLSPGTQCTFRGNHEYVNGGFGQLQSTNCTIKTSTECQPSCQFPATCVSEGGGCNCHCNEGFSGSIDNDFYGTNCNNINECLIGTDNCNDSAECTDTVGGYNCTCAVGFEWDGRTCSSDRVSIPSSIPTWSPPTSAAAVLPDPTGADQLLPSESPLRGSTLLDTYSMTTLIQPSVTSTTQMAIQGTDQLLPSESPLRDSTLLDTYSMTTLIQPSVTDIPVGSEAVPAVLPAVVAVVCAAALLVLVTVAVALIALHRNRCQSNRFYGLKFTDELDPNFQPVKINETPYSLGSLHSIFHTLHPQTAHDSISISVSEDSVDATSSGIAQSDPDKISLIQEVKTGANETGADLNAQNAEKTSLISQQGDESLMGSTGSIELGCLPEIPQSGSNISLRMSSCVGENTTQPITTPMPHPSGGYVQDSNIGQAAALPAPTISPNNPALQPKNTSGENLNLRMNCLSGDYVQDANRATIRDATSIGLEASGGMELGSLDLEGEANDETSLSILDDIVMDHVHLHSNTLPIQNSSQGYMQESDVATFPVQPCIGSNSTQIHSESEYKRDNSLQRSSNDGVQNNHQPAEDVCTQRCTSGYTLQGDDWTFKGKPGGQRSSQGEHAAREVPLNTLQFTNTGADGYVEESQDKILQLPPSLSTESYDPSCFEFHTDCNTTTNIPPAATPFTATQHPSLDYVQDSNTERISVNTPALHQAQENTSGENRSNTNIRMNCTSGDYVCDATNCATSSGNGAYISDVTSIGDVNLGCLDMERESNDEVLLSMLDMTEMHGNPLPMQSSSQGYMEESDAATLSLPGEHAVREVPFSTLQFTNTGADGYRQQNKDTTPQLPPSLSTGASHDPNRIGFRASSTTNAYSAATLFPAMQHTSLDYVQDSNTERICSKVPALHLAQENTSGENRSNTNHRMNCTSGDYVHDADECATSSGNGAYITDVMNVDVKASSDMEIGCLETDDEILLSISDMTGMDGNPLPMQSSSQGYMEESDATTTFTLPGERDLSIFNVGQLSSEGEHAVCEVPLSTTEFTNTGADGYMQQNEDKTHQLPLSTGTSHDQIGFHTDCNSTTSTYSAANATTGYIQENPPPFSSSSSGEYIQNATAFASVKTSLSIDSGREEIPIETSEAEEIQARSMVNSGMQNDVQNIDELSYQKFPPTVPLTEYTFRTSPASSPTSHTNTPLSGQRIAREMSLSSGYITQSSTDGSVFNLTSSDPDSDLENMADLESHKCQDYAIATENSWVLRDSSYNSPLPETNVCTSSQSNQTGYYLGPVSSPVVTLSSKADAPESQMSTGSIDFCNQLSLPAIHPGYSSNQSTPTSSPPTTNGGYTLPSLLTRQYAGSIEHQPEPITRSLDVSGKLPFEQRHMSRPNTQELEQYSVSNANSHQSAGEYQNTAMTADSGRFDTGNRHLIPSLLSHLHPGTIDQPLKLPSTESLPVSAYSPIPNSHMNRFDREFTPEFDLCSVSNANSCPPASDYIPGFDQCSGFQSVSEYQTTAMKTGSDTSSMDSRHLGPSSLTSLHHGTTYHPPNFSGDSLPVLANVSRSNSPEFDQRSVSNASSFPLASQHRTNTRSLNPDPSRTENRCFLPSLLSHFHPGAAELQTDVSPHSTDASVNWSHDHPSSLPAGTPDGYSSAPSLEDKLQSNVHNSILRTLFPDSKAVGHGIANTDYVDIEAWPFPTFAY